MGEAMLGLAAVARTRPAWAGTAAATLLNMVEKVCMCSREVFRLWQSIDCNG